jgi:hypothetical protein
VNVIIGWLGISIAVRNFEGHVIVASCLINMTNLEPVAAEALTAYQAVVFSK